MMGVATRRRTPHRRSASAPVRGTAGAAQCPHRPPRRRPPDGPCAQCRAVRRSPRGTSVSHCAGRGGLDGPPPVPWPACPTTTAATGLRAIHRASVAAPAPSSARRLPSPCRPARRPSSPAAARRRRSVRHHGAPCIGARTYADGMCRLRPTVDIQTLFPPHDRADRLEQASAFDDIHQACRPGSVSDPHVPSSHHGCRGRVPRADAAAYRSAPCPAWQCRSSQGPSDRFRGRGYRAGPWIAAHCVIFAYSCPPTQADATGRVSHRPCAPATDEQCLTRRAARAAPRSDP